VGVGLVVEYLDGAIVVNEILVEEGGVVVCFDEYLGKAAFVFFFKCFQLAELSFVSA